MADETRLVDQGVSTKEAADVIGIGIRRVQQLIAEGRIKQDEHGRVRLGDAVQGYIGYLESRQPRQDSESAQLARAQRGKLELQMRRQRGELLPAAMVEETEQLMASTFIAQIDGQPSRLANELAGIDDPAIVRERLQDDGRRIRTVVSEALERRAAALSAMRDAGADVAPAAEADAERVGGGEQDLPAGERGAGPVPQ